MNTFCPRIYLRALEPNDYKVSVKWRNDDEIAAMVGGPRYFVSEEKERQWVERAVNDNSRDVLAICLKENDKYIGNVMIQEIDWINRSAHVPILIGDKEEWGKGYATEARMLALKFVFDERGIERVWATVLEDNVGSLRMHEKCGYKQEGVLRRSVFKNGKFKNQVLMSVLREEFQGCFERYSSRHNG